MKLSRLIQNRFTGSGMNGGFLRIPISWSSLTRLLPSFLIEFEVFCLVRRQEKEVCLISVFCTAIQIVRFVWNETESTRSDFMGNLHILRNKSNFYKD